MWTVVLQVLQNRDISYKSLKERNCFGGDAIDGNEEYSTVGVSR